ncbi:MAG: class I SAM-dependent methyltransferase [Bacteroidetes bacterium CHB5]|nr:class I SAM-dependent methyltransferase [Bacteroidetes bacterium CHB5]
MISKLRDLYRQQRFRPNFLLGMILNDQYLAKLGLHNFIKGNASRFSGSVLDVGCGWKPYRQLFNCSSYIGLDIQTNSQNKKTSSADIYYDGLTMPFTDCQFNYVITTEVIEHVADTDLFIREISRVLKPGGEVLLTTPFVWPEHGAPYDFQRLTSFGVDLLMRRNGFEKVIEKKILNGPELFPILAMLYLNNMISRLVSKLNSNRYISIFLFLMVRPVALLFNLLSVLFSFLPRDKNLYFNNGVIYMKLTSN